jgi:hypothetical protein
MGTMLYGLPPAEVPMDDRVLAHLKVVIVSKLRRNESFLLSWELSEEQGPGRKSVWMHPSIPLQFEFDENKPPTLNTAWLEELARASMSVDGLRIGPEPLSTEPSAGPRPVKARTA